MIQKRKGSRLINVNGVDYSWLRGKSVTEIRNLETNKAKHVPNAELEKNIEILELCDCCDEPTYIDGKLVTYPGLVTTPSTIRDFIVSTQL